jgi:transposase-like protein
LQSLIRCPYCGEENIIVVDESAGRTQQYVEDCQVCCRPWQVIVTADGDDIDVELRPMAE